MYARIRGKLSGNNTDDQGKERSCPFHRCGARAEFSKPSVSRAMGLLRDQGFISMEQGGDIQLTEEGLAKAKSIYARHLLLTAFLQEVTGVSEEMAEENACRMEHILDQEVVDGISTYMSKNK